MTTVQSIYDYIKTLAPEYMAEEWDHVGLLCGRSDREVKRVLVALDPFRAVCEEAKVCGCQLLVTHHPCLWELKAVNDQTQEGRNLLFLIENAYELGLCAGRGERLPFRKARTDGDRSHRPRRDGRAGKKLRTSARRENRTL